MGTHPIFESDFDCLTEIDKDGKQSIMRVFGKTLELTTTGSVTCAVFSTLALAYWFRRGSRKKHKHIPHLKFYVNKAKNVEYVRRKLAAGQLPDVYKDTLTGVIIITDFELLQKVFQCEHASSRLDHPRSALEERLLRI